jgi:hypothetical protein
MMLIFSVLQTDSIQSPLCVYNLHCMFAVSIACLQLLVLVTITLDPAAVGVEAGEVEAAFAQRFQPFADSCASGFPLFSHN